MVHARGPQTLLIAGENPDIWAMANDIELPDSPAAQLPAVVARNEKLVRERFWKKLLRYSGHVPFSEDLAAAWYCVTDPTTPGRVRGILLAAMAYFVTPVDALPDILPAIGFTDDAAVLALALGMVARSIKPEHREQARKALGLPPESGT